MEYREVGRSGVKLSVVGFGTAQLQMLPERQAIAAMRRAFELGVNWVHTAPDYGGVVVPLRLATDAGVLAFFGTTTVFGTPVDITLAELALEAFYPADEQTAEILRRRS